MGSNRKLVFGALFIVAGLIFWGLFHVINNSSTTPTPTPVVSQISAPASSGHSIAFAKTDIPQGSIITKEMLGMRDAPAGSLTTGFVTNIDDQAAGFISRVPISKNATIRPADDFVGHISETGIAGALRPNMRALVIPMANKPTLHDLVRIGNFVDINAAFDGQEARTIVQNVRVLAVDVFGNDFPQVNVAVRGPFKADAKEEDRPAPAPVAPGAPAGPGVTPTPTPGPAQPAPRPDPSITVEVTPAQANTILLAQASNGVIDFTVLPAVPGGLSTNPVLVGTDNPNGGTTGVTTVSQVTRAQIAPYAERKKTSGAPATRVANAGEKFFNSASKAMDKLGNPGFPPPVRNGDATSGPGPFTITPGPGTTTPVENPTYQIPVYADGKLVRSDSVLKPQE